MTYRLIHLDKFLGVVLHCPMYINFECDFLRNEVFTFLLSSTEHNILFD